MSQVLWRQHEEHWSLVRGGKVNDLQAIRLVAAIKPTTTNLRLEVELY